MDKSFGWMGPAAATVLLAVDAMTTLQIKLAISYVAVHESVGHLLLLDRQVSNH